MGSVIEKYGEDIIGCVRKNMGLDEDDDSQDEKISKMSKQEILNRVCNWNGLINYAPTISNWIENIYGISLEEFEE